LKRHQADREACFREVGEKPYQSEMEEKYRQRFLKYRDKLFTFLDHDGVSW
jgi:hypothetical protein